ncbi:nucleic acid/nucleotide deaminase domain-containing protein [Embleya hyalina]|uniref:SUKH-4 immunity protein of toxin-antitoxin system n=1 Tax=Embleya hyalina TaxID=516124 RepID=A0A401Z0S0_9ACTN|nr:nucleic acid/nucleotide deaminase domain-containing protein [Embleya hyalina]GCE00401.1 hypothetical protein EHYA_08126 [Embleya hyalina]
MNVDLSAALHQRFGRDGLRTYASPHLDGLPMPVQVGAYFIAAEDEHPLTMGAFADAVGETLPDAGLRDRVRLGTDQGAELYVAGDGSVRALFLGVDLPAMAVASSVEAFADGLLTLDQMLPRIAAVDEPVEGFPLYRELREALTAADPAAFVEREAWWPRVLDDVRLPLNIGSSAAFEVVDAGGEPRILTESSRPGLPHPEELLWYRLAAGGVEAEDVRRVYCELEPCLMPGHYCALWMGRLFPDAEFTHGFGYGATAQSREDGVRALMTHIAEQAGNR